MSVLSARPMTPNVSSTARAVAGAAPEATRHRTPPSRTSSARISASSVARTIEGRTVSALTGWSPLTVQRRVPEVASSARSIRSPAATTTRSPLASTT